MKKEIEHKLSILGVDPTHSFLLAISGGVDSMVLLDVFQSLSLSFAVAHCNFGLRGTESDQDEQLVLEMCQSYGVECFTKKFDISEYKKENRVSTQMAARAVRYNWFDNLLKDQSFDFLVTAHHLDDSVETLFLNLSRGTGIEGLKGIQEKTAQVLRPLLSFSKEEIRKYAAKHSVAYREDKSNSSNTYKRNRLRNSILPLFREINPGFIETMAGNLSNFRESVEFYRNKIEEEIRSILRETPDGFEIEVDKLKHSENSGLVGYECFKKFGFERSQSDQLLRVLQSDKPVGKEFFSPNFRMLVDRDKIFLRKIEKKKNEIYVINNENKFVTFDLELTFNHIPIGEIDLLADSQIAFLDAQKIKFPLQLRRWKEGDKFRPLGMNGKKKVSDFLIDRKMSRIEKEKTWVLLSEDRIFWLVGHRIDDSFKLTDSTQKVLKITFESK